MVSIRPRESNRVDVSQNFWVRDVSQVVSRNRDVVRRQSILARRDVWLVNKGTALMKRALNTWYQELKHGLHIHNVGLRGAGFRGCASDVLGCGDFFACLAK